MIPLLPLYIDEEVELQKEAVICPRPGSSLRSQISITRVVPQGLGVGWGVRRQCPGHLSEEKKHTDMLLVPTGTIEYQSPRSGHWAVGRPKKGGGQSRATTSLKERKLEIFF